jgi:hypothetical protein|tara:strand:- start:237 stop:452 length:216 start_codon:yes stop_codon:yes gene_type:complete
VGLIKTKKMSEKDVVYALQMLHVIQSKKNAILFAEFVSNDQVFDDFWSMSKEHQENIYQQYLNQNNEDENK